MTAPLRLLTALVLVFTAAQLPAQFRDPPWRYTTQAPADGWQAPAFDDAGWERGRGGFGAPDTPGVRVGTEWYSPDIWLRREVTLDAVPARPALLVYHDEDVEVFVNGVRALARDGYVTDYQVVPLDGDGRQALRAGANLIAVHCHQTRGGQGVDVHVVDADAVPELPPPPRPGAPFRTALTTAWGDVATPTNAWREYPRPQLVRARWQNWNGAWDHAITPRDAARPTAWQGPIVVPFCVESALSGVQRLLHEDQALWYHRAIEKPAARPGERTLLHFEACDYRTRVWIGDVEVGEHVGGNTPFHFDVTDALAATDGDAAHVYVRVEDATGDFQLRGKQVRRPNGIWYTRVSGIWGTVWTEQVPAEHVARLTTTTRVDGTVTVRLHGVAGEATAVARLDGVEVARASGPASAPLTLVVASPRLWSPDSPTLYDLEVVAGDDVVRSYFGIREVGRARDAQGHWRLTLNGASIFHWGPLDQGWWPDGLLTPPSDAAMRWDVDYLKAAGFNMIRKHIKVEPRRFYAYCDRVGMMLWQDQVSGGASPKWTRLKPDPEDARWPADAHAQYMRELDAMITTLENHPCIVMWVPFNEAWGQHDTVAVAEWTRERDPTRLVNAASGGNFWPAGDVCDHHSYPHPSFPFELDDRGGEDRFADYALVVGEFGGHGLAVQGHLWRDQANNWGYGGLPADAAEYKDRLSESLRRLAALQARGICAAVYTQTTDVEGEINGLVTYDRRHVKVPAKDLRALSEQLFVR